MKKQSKEIWLMSFILLPVVIAQVIGNDFGNSTMETFAWQVLFSFVGTLLGFGTHQWVKKKSTSTKVGALIGMLTIILIPLLAFTPSLSDEELLEQDWLEQKIGQFEFESPTQLTLYSSVVPAGLENLYTELNMYTDNEDSRTISVIQSKVKTDTLLVEDAFLGSLEGMLTRMVVDLETLTLYDLFMDEEEISTSYSYVSKGDTLRGFGLMFKYPGALESIWLLPQTRTFSNEFIATFSDLIDINYP
ncbi:hypothetical protein SAMN05216474_0313 [Lishizhenia tianjinensis]|uniref:Uncharacterized protein n=1 Tax=Lishizhenia tianjinensis TaxID=477690 RepID=A0A1I6XMC6_9FLAO|nr:hypothetical protein [Lishizhenia tianjinensis]SFT39440.1 hypothetical protein SAMN05216474_0313 [Lishizhenia tianjinensis]